MTKRWKCTRAAARAYIKLGYRVVRIPPGEKGPKIRGWPDLDIKAQEVDEYFQPGDNVGLLAGEPSGGLIDIDLDGPEAIDLAPDWLPDTGLIHGRPSKPRSHFWYQVKECPAPKKYIDIDGTCLVEIRSTGQQTMAPPSLHPDDERLGWDKFGEPALVDASVLQTAVSGLATAALLARHWPKKKSCRHDLAMALAGYLLRQGLDEATVRRLLESAAKVAGDEEWRDRGKTVAPTAEKLRSGNEATGAPRFAELLPEGKQLLRKLTDWLGLDPVAPGGIEKMPYQATPRGLVWLKLTKGGSTPVPLTNFNATIVKDIVEDDGIELRRFVQIEVLLRGRSRRFRIPAEQFSSMSWVTTHLGTNAILYPFGARDHARTAIQWLSGEVPEETHFAHTGWRQIDDQWLFLHAGGAIGPVGPLKNNNSKVTLTGTLAGFKLPSPPTGKRLAKAIRASLRVLDVAPLHSIIAPYAAGWRAALGGVSDLSVFLDGQTGVGKTEVAALVQQHFGAEMDARHLPGSWSSTENALEAQACAAKDVVFVVDDFSPAGTRYKVDNLHGTADRLLRAQGNRSGRQRMARDTSLLAVRPPRGLIMATGEDLPRGHSLRARIVVVELASGDVDWTAMTRCQKDARGGLYAEAMAGFVQFLSPIYGDLRKRIDDEIAALREFGAGEHKRTPTAIAHLALGLRYFLVYAMRSGAVAEGEAQRLWARWWRSLQKTAEAQERHVASANPVTQFLEALSAGLSSGRAHVAALDGEAPAQPASWGWRKAQSIPADLDQYEFIDTYSARGDRIGWVDGEGLYLEPTSAHRVAQRLAREAGQGITLGQQAIRKRLDEAALLLFKDGADRLTIRKMIEGKRRRVLHLSTDSLTACCSPPGQPGQDRKPPPLLSGVAELLVETQLLAYLRDIFEKKKADQLPTTTILAALRPKGERLTAIQLSRRLRRWGIRSGSIWNPKTKKSKRGYKLEWFKEAFETYLPPNSRG